jgi:peptide/nickel transport system permease protein
LLTYVVRRLLWGLLIVWGVYTLSFVVVEAAPGDPFAGIESPKMKEADFQRIREKWGYSRSVVDRVEVAPGRFEERERYEPVPVTTRYLKQLGNLVLEGNLGTSIVQKRPVLHMLGDAIPKTLVLTVTALLLEMVLGVALGILSAVRKGTKVDEGLTVGTLFVYSMPGFWLAEMLVLVLAVKGGWLPSSGMHTENVTQPGFWADVYDVGKHLVMPAFVLGVTGAAGIARFQRSAMLEVIRQDYVRTARAKGLDERTVIVKHALRNALIPVITLLGLSLPFLVSGAVITETIFAWPGMGQQVVAAIPARDIQVITGFTLVASVMVLIGNLLADVLYALTDPRVRLS